MHESFPKDTYVYSLAPCHKDMVRPQVADGGTASDMGSSCEYTE